jgi:GNAT superfamily N-acetyltransferase
MPVAIRVARPGDYARVGELTLAAYRGLEVDHLWGGYDDEILDTQQRADAAEVLVAEVDGRVVGSVTYVADSASPWSEWTHPGEAQFRLLAVDPAARRSGAGRALIEACIDRARASGQSLVIHTTPWMPNARRLYDQLGFVRWPERDVAYDEWREEQDAGIDLPAAWVGQPFLAYRWEAVAGRRSEREK